MKNIETNQDRTKEYLKIFNREKTMRLLVQNQDPIIFDVGANNGSSVKQFKSWWKGAKIHCFEPQEECWHDLDMLAKEYNSKTIFINKCAAGNNPTNDAIFYSHNITTGQSGFNKINLESKDSIFLDKLYGKKDSNSFQNYCNSINHERHIEIIRLDDYMNLNEINKVDILKIDTQGYEPEVLDGFGKRLSKIDVVITELMFYDYYERSLSFADIEKYLIPAGFQLYDISHISKNPMNGRTDWVDVIYINEKIR